MVEWTNPTRDSLEGPYPIEVKTDEAFLNALEPVRIVDYVSALGTGAIIPTWDGWLGMWQGPDAWVDLKPGSYVVMVEALTDTEWWVQLFPLEVPLEGLHVYLTEHGYPGYDMNIRIGVGTVPVPPPPPPPPPPDDVLTGPIIAAVSTAVTIAAILLS